jgi:hypothetical protein
LKTANYIFKKFGKAKIVTATNVFAHMDKLKEIINSVKICLDSRGIFVTESHYLIPLLRDIQYDTVYHEHLRYYSLTSLNYLFKKNNLEIFDAKEIPTHGGSIRVFCSRIGRYSVTRRVKEIYKYEKKFLNYKYLSNFNSRVVSSKLNLMKILSNIKNKEKKSVIVGVSAPSRSATLINYVGLNAGIIKFILEIKGSYKIDCYMPGTKIPVVKETKEILKKTNYLILFSWHIAKELIKNLRNRGFKGKFIIPLPKPKIVN